MRVIGILEKVFSEMLSRWHRTQVTVLYADGVLRAFGHFHQLSGYREQREIPLRKPNQHGWNTIRKIVEQQMYLAADVEQYYQVMHATMMGWGLIERIIPGEKLIVHLTLTDRFGETFTVYAECPLKHIGLYERTNKTFSQGNKRAFWVRAIHPVTLGGMPRLNVSLNRTSKNLPVMLLKEMMKDEQFMVHCERRYPGKISVLQTNGHVPRKITRALEEELNETVLIQPGAFVPSKGRGPYATA